MNFVERPLEVRLDIANRGVDCRPPGAPDLLTFRCQAEDLRASVVRVRQTLDLAAVNEAADEIRRRRQRAAGPPRDLAGCQRPERADDAERAPTVGIEAQLLQLAVSARSSRA